MIHEQIAELARLNDDPGGGGITREVYTPTYARAVELVSGWMREAGLGVRLDAVGNLFGRWPGADPEAPVLLTGSHIDTTLNAGPASSSKRSSSVLTVSPRGSPRSSNGGAGSPSAVSARKSTTCGGSAGPDSGSSVGSPSRGRAHP